jgi:hypothetical protein
MPVLQWLEEDSSRSATIVRKGKKGGSRVDVTFLAFGTDSDAEVHAYANAYFSTASTYTVGDYVLLVDTYSLEYLGDEAFRVTATYTQQGQENEAQPDPLRRTRSFETTGGTTHITQAKSETRYSGTPGGISFTAPDVGLAIGYDGEKVNGVDILIPSLQWTETYDVPHSVITNEYIKMLSKLTGTTNSEDFRSFRPGEVLFAGCSGSQGWDSDRGNGPWNLSYKFIASQNAEDLTETGGDDTRLTVGSITNIEKKGHEYLWVVYADVVINNAKSKQPAGVYVNKVYESEDFALLGIGTD